MHNYYRVSLKGYQTHSTLGEPNESVFKWIKKPLFLGCLYLACILGLSSLLAPDSCFFVVSLPFIILLAVSVMPGLKFCLTLNFFIGAHSSRALVSSFVNS